jgi:succinoglycan biosynthesis protein ExoL
LEKKNKDFDIIFLYSGNPLPAMLDMAHYAHKTGFKVGVIILERGRGDLILDSSLVNYELKIINVNYKSVGLSRFMSMPLMYIKLLKYIKNNLKEGGILMPGSYDLLVYTYLINMTLNFDIYYQVRDLHTLQVTKSTLSSLIRGFEKLMLKKVKKILVSSPGFIDYYYKKIYNGNFVLIENIPSIDVWKNYKISNSNRTTIRIGFIGIIRYKKSLFQLIEAVEELNNQGYSFEVLFAGGGDISDLKQKIKLKECFIFKGAYEYAKDIIELYTKIDLIYSVYDGTDFNCKVAMPNKYYESILTKKPILVASNTFLASKVEKMGIGADVISGDTFSLVEKLKQISQENSWFNNAQNNLLRLDSEVLFKSYEFSLKEALLK